MMKRLNLNQWEKVKIAFWSLDHEFNLPLLSLLLFLLPTQFGRHFWLSFSYLGGLRVDYLAPTLYVTDLILLLLCLLSLKQLLSSLRSFGKRTITLFNLHMPLFSVGIIAIAFICMNTLVSTSPSLTVYGWLKCSELIFFFWILRLTLQKEKMKQVMLTAFLAGVTLQALIALLQWQYGGSLGGVWYFLGERMFHGDTPGIANATIFGELVLRPYGTLPHPNVLAAFLLLGNYFLMVTPDLFIGRYTRLLKTLLILLFTVVLGITLSRVALLLILILFIWWIMQRKQKKLVLVAAYVGILSLVVLFPTILERFASLTLTDETITTREFLFLTSLEIIRSHPLVGTGLYTFLPSLIEQSPMLSYSLTQPVHSVFVLMVVELGVPLSLLVFVFCLSGVFSLIKKKMYTHLLLAFLLIVLGSIDHYFWTLQSGQLLLVFCLVFLFTPVERNLV